jgi:hypothetical protein
MGHSNAELRAYARMNGPILGRLVEPMPAPMMDRDARPFRSVNSVYTAMGELSEALISLQYLMAYARENPAGVRRRIRRVIEAAHALAEESERP